MEAVRRRLKMYRALDNKHRLRIMLTLAGKSGLSFNELAGELGLERGLLAYHLAVLKNASLVELKYERRSKKLTKYYLTENGIKVLKELGLIR